MGIRNVPTIKIDEDASIVQGLAEFYGKTIKIIKREIISYGIVLSNLAEKTRSRLPVSSAAGDTSTAVGSGTITDPTTRNTVTLPNILLEAVDTYAYLCQGCAPKRYEAQEAVRDKMRQEILNSELTINKNKLRNELQEEWKQEVGAELTQEVEVLYSKRSDAAITAIRGNPTLT